MSKILAIVAFVLFTVAPVAAGQTLVFVVPVSYAQTHTFLEFLEEFLGPTGCKLVDQPHVVQGASQVQIELPVKCPTKPVA